jgi:hypothetical protein
MSMVRHSGGSYMHWVLFLPPSALYDGIHCLTDTHNQWIYSKCSSPEAELPIVHGGMEKHYSV